MADELDKLGRALEQAISNDDSPCERAKKELDFWTKQYESDMQEWDAASHRAKIAQSKAEAAKQEFGRAESVHKEAAEQLFKYSEEFSEAKRQSSEAEASGDYHAKLALKTAALRLQAAETKESQAFREREQARKRYNDALESRRVAHDLAVQTEQNLQISIELVAKARAKVEQACGEKPTADRPVAEPIVGLSGDFFQGDSSDIPPSEHPPASAARLWLWGGAGIAAVVLTGLIFLLSGPGTPPPGGAGDALAGIQAPGSSASPSDQAAPSYSPPPADSASQTRLGQSAAGFKVDFGAGGTYSQYSSELNVPYRAGTSSPARAVSWVVCDANGNLVATIPLQPQANIEDPVLRARRWRSSNAKALPPGTYRVTVVAEADDGQRAKMSFLFDPSKEIPEDAKQQAAEECHAQ